MQNYELKPVVSSILQFLEEMTGCNLKELTEQSSFKGTLGTYINAKDLFAINNNIQSGDYGIAYEKEVTFLKNFLSEIRLSHNFDRLIEECKELGSILLEAHTIFKDYMIWAAEEKKHFREYLFNNEFLKEEEKTEDFLNKFSYEWVDAAKKSVQSKLLQLYNFGNASNTTLSIGHTVPYSISDALCISDDINLCIGANKGQEEDMCYARLALKIDRELAFSHFIITIQYKDRIWLVTDKPTMPNPQFRENTRNPYRWREEAFDNIQLPYGLLDHIEEWRKESKSIAKENSSEVYIKSMRDFLPPASKILIKLIIEELIYNVIPMKQFDLKRIGLAGENVKLLGNGKTLENVDDIFVKINQEANEERINSIIYPTSTELIKIDPAKAVAQYIEAGELCTVDEIRKIAIWSQKEELRRHKQKLLNDAYTRERMRADEEELNKILFDNVESLYEVVFSADMVFMCIEDENARTFGSSNGNAIIQICDTSLFKSSYSKQYLTNYHINKFRDEWHVANCVMCDCENPVNLQLKIYSYKELCGILKVKREQLPYTFQNYTANLYVPYIGNTILDNVNPEYKILDPRSRELQHYYSIGIPLNKRCFNKLRKKYWKYEKSLVTINYTKGTIKIQEYGKGNQDT